MEQDLAFGFRQLVDIAEGALPPSVPQHGFADFMDLAVQEIWHYGSDAAQVPGRLTAMLADLSAVALRERLPVLRRWAERCHHARPRAVHTTLMPG